MQHYSSNAGCDIRDRSVPRLGNDRSIVEFKYVLFTPHSY
jgi:hypothetical protein